MALPNYFTFENLTAIIGEPLTTHPAFTWACGCWATLVPATEDDLLVTPCSRHRRSIVGDEDDD